MGFSAATLSNTFTKTLISSSSSRAHLVEGGLEGLAAQLARKLACPRRLLTACLPRNLAPCTLSKTDSKAKEQDFSQVYRIFCVQVVS